MNKMVVVTGATTGTGYCVAQKFAANGYDVCITSRDQARAQEAAARLKAENDGKIATGWKCWTSRRWRPCSTI